MRNIKISLAGDLGSGKSTVADILAEKYQLEKVSIGKIQRGMAKELGMTTTEYNVYMENHPELDKILDDKLASYELKEGNYLFDSRLAWHFVPSSFSVYMSCSMEVSAKRIFKAKRDDESYEDINESLKKIKERRESEKHRYYKFYGVDITDLTNYDFVIDTDNLNPTEVAEKIIEAFENNKQLKIKI